MITRIIYNDSTGYISRVVLSSEWNMVNQTISNGFSVLEVPEDQTHLPIISKLRSGVATLRDINGEPLYTVGVDPNDSQLSIIEKDGWVPHADLS